MLKPFLTMLLPLALLACSGGGQENKAETVAPQDRITPALQQLAKRAEPGTLGVAILDLQSGQSWGVNADKSMPMQSVFKLPLGIFVFHKAAEGAFALDDEVTLTEADLLPLYSPVADAFDGKKDYMIEELVRATVAQSDNVAADLLMKRVGGPEALTAFFKERGFEDFRVDRYEAELQPQSTGLPPLRPGMSEEDYDALRESVPIEKQKAAMTLYLADPRDRMSAATAVRMLAALESGKLLPPEMTEKMMAILKGTTTGAKRLKAGLPGQAILYHKTGTGADVDRVNSATNDIGIIELPDGRKLAVAVFLSGSELPSDQREAIIAEVARIATGALAEPAAVP